MPKVGGVKFPYTKAGYKDAAKAKDKLDGSELKQKKAKSKK